MELRCVYMCVCGVHVCVVYMCVCGVHVCVWCTCVCVAYMFVCVSVCCNFLHMANLVQLTDEQWTAVVLLMTYFNK